MISAPPRRFLRQTSIALLVLTALWLVPAASLATGTMSIACLDVGQGDATVIISPSGQTLLFDGGKSGRGSSVILPYLNAQGITYLDYMVASHYHSDHIGGLDEVIAQVPVGVAYDRGWSYTTLTYNTYASAVQEVRQTILPGQVIDLGEDVTVTCLALNGNGQLPSPYNNSSYENEYGVCLLVQYGGFDFFVAGDLTGNPDSGYEDIETSLAPMVGDIDVYRVNHHASDSSSNAFFLQNVQAEVSVISLGDNSYGHPHQPVLNRLVQYGSFVYQTEIGSGGTLPATDLRVIGGHVVIETDGVDVYTVAGDQWQIDEDSMSPAVLGPLASVRVLGNYPNPFNPRTEIRFETPTAGAARLEVYDLAGRRIALHSFQAEAGLNLVPWLGQDDRGHQQPGGIYLYTVTTAAGRDQGRMTLVK